MTNTNIYITKHTITSCSRSNSPDHQNYQSTLRPRYPSDCFWSGFSTDTTAGNGGKTVAQYCQYYFTTRSFM